MHPRDGRVVADSGMRALTGVNRFDRAAFTESVESLRQRLLAIVGTRTGKPTCPCGDRARGPVLGVPTGWRVRWRRADGSVETRIVLVEYDGEVKCVPEHATSASPEAAARAVVREKRREGGIREVPGTTVLRFDETDLRDEAACFRRLTAALPAGYPAQLAPVAAPLTGPRTH